MGKRAPRTASLGGLLGTAALGVALGTASALAIRRRVAPRTLGTPTEVPPRPLRPREEFPHAELTPVLAACVDDRGLVDYDALLADPEDLYRFVAWVSAYSPLNTPVHFASDASRLCYWLNAYNALVLLAVAKAYPVRSILLIPPVGRAFSGLFFSVGGRLMSLREIARGVIWPTFREPRMHFALTCAANGCPGLLRQEAYLPDLLAEQLETQARAALGTPAVLRVDYHARTIGVSALFTWYRQDFLDGVREQQPGQPEELLTFLRPYLPDEAREMVAEGGVRLTFLPFDWRLNRSRRHGAREQAA